MWYQMHIIQSIIIRQLLRLYWYAIKLKSLLHLWFLLSLPNLFLILVLIDQFLFPFESFSELCIIIGWLPIWLRVIGFSLILTVCTHYISIFILRLISLPILLNIRLTGTYRIRILMFLHHIKCLLSSRLILNLWERVFSALSAFLGVFWVNGPVLPDSFGFIL